MPEILISSSLKQISNEENHMITNNYDIILNPSRIDARDLFEAKGMTETIDPLYRYIDICIIDTYINKPNPRHYEDYQLSVDELSEKDFTDFLNVLLKDDTDVRDTVYASMQKLINFRLDEKYYEDRYKHGMTNDSI